jgi:ATP-dependent RNA helicase RhlE
LQTFNDLGLIQPLCRAVEAEGYSIPTPIQLQAIPALLEGRDLIGCAQTGTGKTAAFALPILQYLSEWRPAGKPVIRALVVSPTRELAAQIGEAFAAYGQFLPLRGAVIFGGVNQKPQVTRLRQGIDILVATPGRMLDLQQQGFIDLSAAEYFVLDEADRMLDMGFIHDIRRILAMLPSERQSLLFSATMPPSIEKLGRTFMNDPLRIDVAPEQVTLEEIEQQVMFLRRPDKKNLLARLLKHPSVERSIVFTRTKHGANRLVKQLYRAGVDAVAIHGNKSQSARNRAMNGFKSGNIPVLIATDIASRGIDVDGVTHVFNYELPNIAESYVHRIGRTGRAGRTGVAVSFCDETEGQYLRDIEKLTGVPLEVYDEHEWHWDEAIPPPLRNDRPRRYRQGAPRQTDGSDSPPRRRRRRRPPPRD